MKRVLLVNPNTEQSPYPVAPLGLCLVAASLKNEYSVQIYDGTFKGASDLTETVQRFSPDYIGISIRNVDDVTSSVEKFYIDEIRAAFVDVIRTCTKAPIILGGAGFNLFPQLLVEKLGADFGVLGEAEHSFLTFLHCLDIGQNPENAFGIVLPKNETASKAFVSSKQLNLPFSNIDELIDFEPYRTRGSYPIQTKRGCDLKCVYCSYPLIEGTSYRLRDSKEIVDEIEQAALRLGSVTFEFVDSTFNAPLEHAENVCREIIKRKLNLRLRSMGVNPGKITDSLLDLMCRAGFAQIVCSADTASEETLIKYQKGFTRQKLIEVASLIRKHDMPSMWSFIFGGPGETEATIQESFDFIEQHINSLDMVHMVEGIRIYPRTPIFQIAVEEGLIEAGDSLLRPVYYISPKLGKERLQAIICDKSKTIPNCIRGSESKVSPEIMQKALELRKEQSLDEPMFRTLLRLKIKD